MTVDTKKKTVLYLLPLGAEYEDQTSQREKEDDKVFPGESHTYVWQVLKENGPMASDPPCLTYSYLSHVDLVKDLNSGLIGALLVCKEGNYMKEWNWYETKKDKTESVGNCELLNSFLWKGLLFPGIIFIKKRIIQFFKQ